MSSKRTNFNPVWLTEESFMTWLVEDETDKHRFKCRICNSSLDLGNMGKRALTIHQDGKKHVMNSKLRSSESSCLMKTWVKQQSSEEKNVSSISGPSTSGVSAVVPSLDAFITRDDGTKAEIMLILNKIMQHESFNSTQFANKIHASTDVDLSQSNPITLVKCEKSRGR